ncbi:MAG: tetratricopeptide repeat protein [Spirochaetales bacterium]|uniref:Tetratricopeptide repeat protein n=1 Tax=Candidatus Thalassospirochaeta sargassi TaxID=3119039 RepID=A0AAJ1ID69_9SPIO|nr:tetratricopeptide repeat protein [Spirochaetales bacterium]
MKKVVFLILLLSLTTPMLFPQSESTFTIHALPHAELPLTFGADLFDMGAGADLDFEVRMPFRPVLGVQAELGYSYLPLLTGDGVNFINAGGGLSLTLPRIGASIVPSLFSKTGYYYGVIGDETADSGGNLYFGGGGRFTWAASPNFNLGLAVQYKNYLDGFGGMLHHALNIGLASSFNFHGSSKLEIMGSFFKDIFPVQYKYYSENSIGSIEILNEGSVPYESVTVSVFIDKYMDNPTAASGPDVIEPGESAVIEFSALFAENVLDITEATIVSAEINVEFLENGKQRSESFSEQIRIYDRHAMTWDDTRKAAAFVNYKDPVVISAGKMLSHLVKSTVNVVDVNLCTAIAVHQALGAYGMEYVIDPTSPFTEFSGDAMAVDYIQFPSNTIDYRSGDCDDLSILYTSILQSVGIDTAFITVPGHIFIALALKTAPEDLKKVISTSGDIIEYNGRAWVPVEITMVANPFMQAWKAGAKQWHEYEVSGESELIPMSESWKLYEPVGFSVAKGIDFLSEDEASSAYLQEIERFINREIYAQTDGINRTIERRGKTARSLNKLGTVYARYGKTVEAFDYFEQALAMENYYPALVNIGNLLLLENDFQGAVEKYRSAEKLSTRSAALYLQMSRAYSGLGMFDMAEETFSKVKQSDPALAERYEFIDTTSSTARASGYSLTDNMIWLEEEE